MTALPDDLPADVARRVAAAGQEGVLSAWDTLDASSRSALVAQLRSIDWALFADLRQRVADRRNATMMESRAPDLGDAVTPPCLRLRDEGNQIQPATAIARGAAALTAGRVGAILVAGGQGTRLGCEGPKGIFPVGPVSRASLFELLLGKLVAVSRRFGAPVPLAIMTSSATDEPTRDFLAQIGRAHV